MVRLRQQPEWASRFLTSISLVCDISLLASVVTFSFVGQVGPPLPCNHVKLVDVPEMDYYAKDGKGEVRCHMTYNWCTEFAYRCVLEEPTWCLDITRILNEQKKLLMRTAGCTLVMWASGCLYGLAALHSVSLITDFFFLFQQGTLKIIDRRKHIFKLAQVDTWSISLIADLNFFLISWDEFSTFYPSLLGGIFGAWESWRCLHAIVVGGAGVCWWQQPAGETFWCCRGNSLILLFQSFPVAIVVPDPEVLPGWAKKQGLSGDIQELCENKVWFCLYSIAPITGIVQYVHRL